MTLKTLLMWTQIFFVRIKKDAFSEISEYVWTGPKTGSSCVMNYDRCSRRGMGTTFHPIAIKLR